MSDIGCTTLWGLKANLSVNAHYSSATMPIMRFQFSLATLLVCMTVLAVVCAAAVAFPVQEKIMRTTQVISPSGIRVASTKVSESRPPTGWDIMANRHMGCSGRRRHARRAMGHPPPEISPPH